MQRTRSSRTACATYAVAAGALLVLALVAPTVATSWVMALILIVLIVAGIEVVRRIVLGETSSVRPGDRPVPLPPACDGRSLRPALELARPRVWPSPSAVTVECCGLSYCSFPRPRRLRWDSCAGVVGMTGRSTGCARRCSRSGTTSGSRTRRGSGPSRSTGRRCGSATRSCSKTASGGELYEIQEKKLTIRDKMEIERGGATVATVKKALITPLRDRFSVEVEGGEDMEAKGNIVDHEYEIERGGDKVAEVSKRWFRVRDTYGIEIRPDQDDALILAVSVCIDQLARG